MNDQTDDSQTNRGYYADNFESIQVRYHKKRNLKARIKAQAEIDGVTVDRWIIQAIEDKLNSQR